MILPGVSSPLDRNYEQCVEKMSRRKSIFLSLGVVAVIIGTLLYFEQISVLYLLATISLVALLLIVAFSDLQEMGKAIQSDRS